MKFQHLDYLLAIAAFAGTGLLVFWERNKKLLRRYEILILVVAGISGPLALTEYFAMKWHAWFYYSSTTLNTRFMAELESYAMATTLAILAAAVTMVYAAKIDRKSKTKIHRSRRKRSQR